jgi:CheY-like chemotaxis protein
MKKVMVVDDDTAVLRTVGLVLRHHGCEVTLASSGADCLTGVRAGFKGVILMDIMMPGLTGWETIRALAQENLIDGILICMLTAKAHPGSEGEGLEHLVFDYLPKPFDNAALLRCVDNAASFLEA